MAKSAKRRKVVVAAAAPAASNVLDASDAVVDQSKSVATVVDDDDNVDADGGDVASSSFVSDGKYRNKQRCLVLCSRGVTARYRHLLEDLRTLLPHHKKESKLDSNSIASTIHDMMLLQSCNTTVFLECRKRGQDAYLWLGQLAGPSVRFHVTNVHTMDELRLTGNCLKGSRPILTFDSSFEQMVHLQLLRELFVNVFGTPRGHPKSKPFVDRVMAFYYADGRIWVRNYQILHEQAVNAKEAHALKKAQLGQADTATSLVEIGPRLVLQPIRIFRGFFGGPTLYQNTLYVTPSVARSAVARQHNVAYESRKLAQQSRQTRKENIVVPDDPLKDVFR